MSDLLQKSTNIFNDFIQGKFKMPEFGIVCPFCNKPLLNEAFRDIRICMNAKDFGSIHLSFYCQECNKMLTYVVKGVFSSYDDIFNGIDRVLKVDISEYETFWLHDLERNPYHFFFDYFYSQKHD